MRRGHQEGPNYEVAKADLHSTIARMSVAQQVVETEGKEDDRHSDLQAAQGEHSLKQARQRHHHADATA